MQIDSNLSQNIFQYSHKKFLEQLTPEDLIITVNQRLSGYLQKNYEQAQIQTGKSVWKSITILPLTVWIEKLWNTLCSEPLLLLSDFQENIIWQNIISASNMNVELLNLSSTATLTSDTYKLLNQWLLNLDHISYYSSLDVQTFISWAKKFISVCKKQNYISRSEILKKVNNLLVLPSSPLQLSKKIYFVGFDDLSPEIQLLQTTLSINSKVENVQLIQEKNIATNRISFHNSQIELQEMARWAYETLVEDPNKMIGCVVANLSEKRDEIVRIFKETFYALGLQKKFNQPPFNISAAKNLNQFSIIQTAIKILLLNNSELNFEDFSFILRTPFIAGAETELDARSLLDVQIRSLGEKKVLLESLLNNWLLKNSCPLMLNGLQKFILLKNKTSNKLSIEDWAHLFTEQLILMGWPGERSLDSKEFQLVERFKRLFNEFANLNQFCEKIAFDQALNLLQQLVSNTLFQPKSTDMPIQILGILEASSIEFDNLWVSGLDNETWPASVNANPFIPIEIQKKYNMPHATSERELYISLNITRRFIQNAQNVIFSHCEFDDDRPLTCSPLIENYSLITRNSEIFTSIEKLIFQTKNLELYCDEVGPCLTDKTISGGSSIFKAQAACPFQAFAKYRLQALSLNETQIGLAAHERGSLVHDILANVWNEISNHAALCLLSDDQLNEIIANATNKSLTELQKIKLSTLKNNLFFLEKKRLQKIIFNWLQIEKLRQPFEVVSCEKKQSASIGELTIHIQIDRVDQLANGSNMIIDYKTGRPSLYDWFSDRPNEPQLPLYTILSEQFVSGILFAQIRSDKMQFKGLTAFSESVPGAITPTDLKGYEFDNMNSIRFYWLDIMHRLADDFCQGKADVSPKEPITCQYCDLQELCRIRSIK